MRILICNERFLFRFGVDRVLLMLGSHWKAAGHEIVMMGNKLDPLAVEKCSDRFIPIPEAPDYLHGNDYTLSYLKEHWNEWFEDTNKPDIAFVAGWPFYASIEFLREQCGSAIFHDYGAVPTDGMNEAQIITQNELRRLRRENLRKANKVIAISSFLEETQSRKDVEGLIPTSYVHLGIDHIVQQLWAKAELDIEQNDVLQDIARYKAEGYKILFQPGRWETGNYKNSPASFDIIRIIKQKFPLVKVLVLANEEGMGGIPEDLKDNYYCMGFVDDATMKEAMILSDAGFSPTLWEGFDLPLGEMQYLDRCMFTFEIGAHPEVAVHPYFLCKDNEEMAGKVIDCLSDTMSLGKNQILQLFEAFRNSFTWKNCAEKLLQEMKEVILSTTIVFIDVTNACHDTANSGVMRVTRKVSHYLQRLAQTVFVLWDDSIHEYVFPYPEEVNLLCSYGGPVREKIQYRSVDGRERSRLSAYLSEDKGGKKVLLFSETISYKIMNEIIPYAHEKGIAVAAIFYDAIPIIRPELCNKEVTDNHAKYMLGLSECELVMPIAAHNGLHLGEFWDENKVKHTCVKTIPLAAEMDMTSRCVEKVKAFNNEQVNILFVSTLEPRKNHIRLLKAFEQMMEHHPELEERVKLQLVGNRYAGNTEIPEFVQEFEKKHQNVKWLGVVDDAKLRDLYSGCSFTVYPSEIEGFGMPIIESLWFGKPCMCSNSGSIGELASGGGCCLTDVLDIDAIEESLYRLTTDENYYVELQNGAVDCKITTWTEYAEGIADAFLDIDSSFLKRKNRHILGDNKNTILQYFGDDSVEKVILCSNYYPPNFVGGAEIIAHNQGRTMQEDGIAKVMAFSIDVSQKFMDGTVYTEMMDEVLVVRLCRHPLCFDMRGFNFFDETVNDVFEELCEIVKPTVVHGHNMTGMSLGIFDIAKKHGAKVCVTLHDNWGFCYKNTMLDNNGELCRNIWGCDQCMPQLTLNGIKVPMGVRKRYFRRMFEKVDALISPSQYLADIYTRAGFGYHKMNVLWNGINVETFEKLEKLPSDKLRIFFVGYFGKHKGVDLLIKAVSLLEKCEQIEINLVGAGEEQEHYKELAAEVGVLKQLRFWGKLANHDIENAYAEADIYCLPSRWPENQPVSITEAMACGIPVIASALGGNRKLVQDGVNGFLFEKESAEDLAAAIQKFLDDRTLLTKMGEAGKEIIHSNDYHCQVKKLKAIYDTIEAGKKVKSKKIIAFKGNVLPAHIDDCTADDIMLSDWILSEDDWEDVVCYVISDGQVLEKNEIQMLNEKGIKVLLPQNERERYLTKFDTMCTYKDVGDMMQQVSLL